MKILSLILAIMLMLPLGGCYDNREIDTLANVLALGVERAEAGIKLYTFAIGNTGGFSSESSGDGAKLLCIGAYGKDIAEAVSSADRRLGKKLSFSHTSVILFSRDAAREGISEDAMYFDTNHKVRPQLALAVADFSPGEYLGKLSTLLEPNADKYFQAIFTSTQSYTPSLRLSEFMNAHYCGYTVTAPLITGDISKSTVTENDVVVNGAGIIYDGRLKGYTDDMSFLGLFYSQKDVYFEGTVIRSIKRPKVKLKGSIAEIEIFARAEGNIDENSLADRAESLLEKYSKYGADLANIMYFARKNYVLYEDYQKFAKRIKDIKYSVKITLEGDEKQ